jgi:hypothetical protein
MTPGDIVTLTVNSPSAGDKRRTYPAGTQFRLRRLVEELPADLGEVRAEQDHGSSAKTRAKRTAPVGSFVEVLAVTSDRSRLLFRAADVERVPAGDCTLDA